MTHPTRTALLAMAAVALFALPGLADESYQHAGDIIVGVDGNDQLKVEAAAHYGMDTVAGPLLFGYSQGSPGLQALFEDEPDEDFYTLTIPGADVQMRIDAIDPGLKLWWVGFGGVADEAGDMVDITADAELHYHGTWHVDSTAPGFDPLRASYEVTFTLIDAGTTGYGDSAPITIDFQVLDIELPGDINGDGMVDDSDFAVLAANFGTTSGATLATGDIDGDGAVDDSDFAILAANFGQGTTTGVRTSIPEPTALAVLGAGAMALVRRR